MGGDFATRRVRAQDEPGRAAAPSKLRVGRVDDPAEARADRFADAVMGAMRTPVPSIGTTEGSHRIRRSTAPPEGSWRASRSTRVRRSSVAQDPLGGSSVDHTTARRITSMSGGAQVPEAVRRSAEQASGRDLGAVRIHRSAESAELSESLQATAFTVGRNIYLGRHAARPGTAAGNHLLAHELGHVVDDGGGATVGRVSRRADLRALDVTGAPTVRRLLGSKKKQQAKAAAQAAALEAKTQAAAAAAAEQHPKYSALLSAVLTVEQRLKVLKQDRTRVSEDAPDILAYAASASRDLPGTEKAPGFGPLKRRLRIAGDEARLLLDEVAVAKTKRQAESIYLDEGRTGKFKALTNFMKEDEFDDQTGRTITDQEKADGIKARQEAGARLGLSKAEQTAITVFTAQDYKYINPATANSPSWMLSNRDKDAQASAAKKNSRTVSQQDDSTLRSGWRRDPSTSAWRCRGCRSWMCTEGPRSAGSRSPRRIS